MRISAIIKAIEEFAPSSYQESWDNTGLQVGSPLPDCTGVLICLDVTPEIVEEAVEKGCNLIVSHHPLFFREIKRLTGSTPQQAAAMIAVANGITIYSSHTAADSTAGGVSYILAEKLGLRPLRALDPLADRLVHMRVMVPESHADIVRAALFDAGAGKVGQYDCCSFNTQGSGTFRALEGSRPFVGEHFELHTENETAIDVVLPIDAMDEVEDALLEVHPYQQPAYYFEPMLNHMRRLGIGIYGVLDAPVTQAEFVAKVKETLGCAALRTTRLSSDPDVRIHRVAVCGGAGGSLINKARAAGAQAYVTADLRYHDFLDNADSGMLLIDAGHYETESPIKEAFANVIRVKFPMVPVILTDIESNPVVYC